MAAYSSLFGFQFKKKMLQKKPCISTYIGKCTIDIKQENQIPNSKTFIHFDDIFRNIIPTLVLFNVMR